MSMAEIDQAQAHIERELESQIAQVRNAPTPAFSRGRCINCDEPVSENRRVCSPECGEDYEHRARQNKRAGVR